MTQLPQPAQSRSRFTKYSSKNAHHSCLTQGLTGWQTTGPSQIEGAELGEVGVPGLVNYPYSEHLEIEQSEEQDLT